MKVLVAGVHGLGTTFLASRLPPGSGIRQRGGKN